MSRTRTFRSSNGRWRVFTPRFSRKMLPISLPLICAETGRFSSDSASVLLCSTSPVAFEPQDRGRISQSVLKCVARTRISASRTPPSSRAGARFSNRTRIAIASRSGGLLSFILSIASRPISGLVDFIPSFRPRTLLDDAMPVASTEGRELSTRAGLSDGAGRADLHDICMSRRRPCGKSERLRFERR